MRNLDLVEKYPAIRGFSKGDEITPTNKYQHGEVWVIDCISPNGNVTLIDPDGEKTRGPSTALNAFEHL